MIKTEKGRNTANVKKYIEDDTGSNKKNIVLYEPDESKHEYEYELHDRIVKVFYDITGIDLTRYVEDVCRIEKRGNWRALKIELLSKHVPNTFWDA